MVAKKRFPNYFGQLRIYSIVDLILLLVALSVGVREFIGVVFLHLSFILYLEFRHRHSNRESFYPWLWIVLLIVGGLFYFKLAVLGFIVASFLYTEKNKSLGYFAPVFRGFQSYFLIGGLIGFSSPLVFLVSGLMLVRNLAGDFRDTEKDKKEGMKTLPILLGLKKGSRYVHIIFLMITSFAWWYLSGVSVLWLVLAYVIELLTYNLTPR